MSSFLEKALVLGITDTLVYECPVVQMGSMHGLIFSNTTDLPKTITVKLFQKLPGETVTITSAKSVAARSEFTWPKPINMSVGDKVLASASEALSITAVASIYMTTTGSVVNMFTVRGEWNAYASFALNDVVSLSGTSYIAISPSQGNQPPSTSWMVMSARGNDGAVGGYDPLAAGNPTTLAGYGIVDAVAASQLSVPNTPNTVVVRDATGNIVANLTGNAASATKLTTARTINGISFDGTANISFNSDAVSEGATNLYFSQLRSRAAVSAVGAGLAYNSATGVFTFSGVASVAGKTGAVTLVPSDVGLGNLSNSLQVINAGGTLSIQSGAIASRPVAATAGRIYLATDTLEMFRDTGAGWTSFQRATTGDVTGVAGTTSLSLVNVGTPGTYTKVTTDAKGRVISGSAPTTLAGYGIADAVAVTGSTMTGNLTMTGSNIILSVGNTVDGRDVSVDGAVLDSINQGTGFIARTGANTYAARTFAGTVNQITIVNGDGIAGNPTISFPNYVCMPGTAGTALPVGTTAQRPASPVPGTFRFNTDSGAAESWNGLVWADGISESDKRFVDAATITVKINPGKGQYATIGAAVAYLNTLTGTQVPSITNPYVIRVSPGVYVEDAVTVPPFVNITGISEYSVNVRPRTTTQDLFVLSQRATLNFMTINGTGPGRAAIKAQDCGDYALVHKVDISDCGIGVLVKSINAYTPLYLEYVGITGGGIAVQVESTSGNEAFLNAENFYVFSSDANANQQSGVFVTGAGADAHLRTFGLLGGDGLGRGLLVQNGGQTSLTSGTISGWNQGAELANTGIASDATLIGVEFKSNTTNDLSIAHPGSTGSFAGVANKSKVSVADASTFTVAYSDPINHGLISTGALMVGATHSQTVDVAPLIVNGMPLGIMVGGTLTRGTGLAINIAAGNGYARTAGVLSKIVWQAQSLTVVPNYPQYVYMGQSGVAQVSPTMPNGEQNVILGRYLSNATGITFVGSIGSLDVTSFNPNIDKLLKQAIGVLYVSGSIVSENVTTPLSLDVTAGHYFYSTMELLPNAQSAIQFVVGYHASGAPALNSASLVSNTQYDNGTNLMNLTAGYYTKHVLYTNGSTDNVGFLMQWGNGNYASQQEAIDAPNPAPIFSPDGLPALATIIVQQGNPHIVKIVDIRPRIGGSAGGTTGATTKHGDLQGLGQDDHPQYLLATGTRALTGELNMGGNALTNVSNVNGVVVGTHASRHTPNGADPLPTAAPSTALTASTTNSEGIANSFARSDHTHSVSGLQPHTVELDNVSAITGTGRVVRNANGSWTAITNTVNLATETTGNLAMSHLNSGLNASATTFLRGDGAWAVTDGVKSVNITAPAAGIVATGGPITTTGAITLALANDLAAVEGLATMGFAVRTAADTWATRVISGTANQVTVTNGDGIAGAPVVAIASNPILPGTASVSLPAGTTAQRPVAPGAGMLRYNSTTDRIESYTAGNWHAHLRQDGDTITGPLVLASTSEFQSYVDYDAIAVPALPGVGKRRMFATANGNFTALDCIDSTGFTTRMFRDTIAVVQNATVSDIQKGQAVYASGASGTLLTIAPAKASAVATMPILGIASELIAAGGSGRVTLIGRLTGLDTSSFVAGASVWVSDTIAGALTSVAPTHPSIVQLVGTVIVANAGSGEISVRPVAALGVDVGTNSSSYTIGATAATSMILKPASTVQRTFTFPDASGTVLTTANVPTITLSGDATGSGTSAIAVTFANSGVTAGTYRGFTVDAKGRITSIAAVTSLAGYGITDAQPLNADLTALTGVAIGLVRKTAAGTWVGAAKVALATEVTGNLPVANLNSGTNASITTYLRGDGTWATPITSAGVVLSVNRGVVSAQSGTTIIPYDNTAPLATEGTQLWTKTITPSSASSTFIIDFSGMMDSNSFSSRQLVMTLYRGNTLLAVSSGYAAADTPHIAALKVVDTVTSITPVTYSVRIGISTTGASWYLGRTNSATFGGTNPTAWTITEVA